MAAEILMAGRGWGKTHHLCEQVVEQVNQGENPVILCRDEPEVQRVRKLLTSHGMLWERTKSHVFTWESWREKRRGFPQSTVVHIDNLEMLIQQTVGPFEVGSLTMDAEIIIRNLRKSPPHWHEEHGHDQASG